MAPLVTLDLGRAPYAAALALQERLVARVKAAEEEEAYLVLVEHDPPVITLGRGADAAHVVASKERLAAEGVDLHETSRGGDVTYHGPGQLVGYPILRVDRHGRDVHKYLRDLEAALLGALAHFGIAGERRSGYTGVWVGAAKVAAIGVALTRWVAYHGFALNVVANLGHFGLIVPCGIRDRGVANLADLAGRPVMVDETKGPVVRALVDVFDFEGHAPGDPGVFGYER